MAQERHFRCLWLLRGDGLAAPSSSDASVIDYVNRVLAGSQRSIHAEMNRGLGVLATVASTAPLVGMLGTVIGIVHGVFRGCCASRATCLAAHANGISEALMSTELGLLVALPALWSFNCFTERLNHIDLEAGNSSMELTTYLVLNIRRLRTAPRTPPQ
jgi:biopolymer transport protein ExbB/TolQ